GARGQMRHATMRPHTMPRFTLRSTSVVSTVIVAVLAACSTRAAGGADAFESGATSDIPIELPPGCGNLICDGSEHCQSCPVDCGYCPPPARPASCGNGTCDGGETGFSCPDDCEVPSHSCG